MISVNKGMFTDAHPSVQPEGMYTYALNAINNDDEGNIGSLISEKGTTLIASIPSLQKHNCIGVVDLNDNEKLLFLINGINSEIGIFSFGTYKQLVLSNCLNFSIDHPIKGTFRYRRNNERLVYFIDGYNEDRVINIDDLEYYMIDPLAGNQLGNWKCELFNIRLSFKPGIVNDITVIDGEGDLELGTYIYSFSYLDKNENQTDYWGHTAPIQITRFSNYTEKRGGFNLGASGLTEASGYFDKVAKSIKLDLTLLDTNYSKIRVAVTKYVSNDEVTNVSYVVGDYDFTNTSLSIVHRGLESFSIPTDDLYVQTTPYKSLAIDQSNSILLRGNLKTEYRDWTKFQILANNFTVTYEDSTTYTATQLQPKNGDYLFDASTYMRDEIYAIGIVFVFKDGTETPVLHIPGRSKDPSYINITTANAYNHPRTRPSFNTEWDTQECFIQSGYIPGFNFDRDISVSTVSHLGLNPGDTIERWKVFNTAADGHMGYYESDVKYPSIKDSSGNFVFPNTSGVMHYVRHHRLPDNYISPMMYEDSGQKFIRPLYIRVSGINIPTEYSNDVIGYYIVVGERDEANKTIVDKGILGVTYRTEPDTTGESFITQATPFDNTTDLDYLPDDIKLGTKAEGDETEHLAITSNFTSPTQYYTFFSPKVDIDKADISFGLLSTEGIINYSRSLVEQDPSGIRYRQFRVVHNEFSTRLFNQPGDTTYFDSQHGLDDNVFVNFNGRGVNKLGTYTLSNEVQAQKIQYVKTKSGFTYQYKTDDVGFYSVRYVAAKRIINPYSLLQQIKYRKASKLIPIATNTTVSTQGDCYITKFTYVKSADKRVLYPWQDHTGNDVRWYVSSLNEFFVESEINHEIRHEGTGPCESIYPIVSVKQSLEPTIELGDFVSSNTYFCDKTTLFNKVYLPNKTIKYYYSNLSPDLNELLLPNTFIWSEISLEDDIQDMYRINLPLNFKDVPTNNGYITNIVDFQNFVFVTTTKSTVRYPVNIQEFQSANDTKVFLGTGAFMSLPGVELNKTNQSYLGNQGRFNLIRIPQGILTIDQQAGQIFILSGEGIDELTNKGMSNWFRQNLPSTLKAQLNNNSVLDNTNDKGPGLITAYDPVNKRLIIHKKDYKFLEPSLLVNGTAIVDSNRIRIDGDSYYFSDANYFEYTGWTISYSFITQSWISFHSYHPCILFTDTDSMYSITNLDVNTKVWKHDGPFGYMYDTDQPMVIEVAVQTMLGQKVHSLGIMSKCRRFSLSSKQYLDVDDTFDQAIVYNSRQTSGLISLVKKSNAFSTIQWSNSVKIKELKNKIWRVGQLRDISVNPDIWTKDWNNLDYRVYNSTNCTGYTDKALLLSSINYGLSLYKLSDFKDTYCMIRLIHTNTGNLKLIFNALDTLNTNSII